MGTTATRVSLVHVCALLLGACHTPQVLPPAAPSSEGWVIAEENDSFRISVDTSGWRPSASRPTLWIAINSVRTEDERRSSSPFLRFEMRQQLDCQRRLARPFDIRTPDSLGTLGIHPVSDTTWRPFEQSPELSPVLSPVCEKLMEMRR